MPNRLARLAPLVALACALALPASAAAATGYQDNLLKSTPDVYWTLDDAVGSPLAHDLTGRVDGRAPRTTFGLPGAFGLSPNAAQLSGGGTIAGDPGAVQHVIELWVKPRVTNPQQTIVRQGDLKSGGWELGIGPRRKLVFRSGSQNTDSKINLPAGRWTMLDVAWSEGIVWFLTNGGDAQMRPKTMVGPTPRPASTTLTVGAGDLGGFDGSLDEVALFATAPATFAEFQRWAAGHYAATSLLRNTAPPAVTGTAVDGQTLTVTPGTWDGSPADISHQWMRCDPTGACDDISGATSLTYKLTPQDVGSVIVVEETATAPAGAVSVVSEDFGPVEAQTPAVVDPPAPADPGAGTTDPGTGTTDPVTADPGTGATDSGTGTTGGAVDASTGSTGNAPTADPTPTTDTDNAPTADPTPTTDTDNAPTADPTPTTDTDNAPTADPTPTTDTGSAPTAKTPRTACVVRLARAPKARTAKIGRLGRVTLRVKAAGTATPRLVLKAKKAKVARVAFKLDRKVLAGGKRALSRKLRVSVLKAGRHHVRVTVTPRHGKARTLRLTLAVKGC